MMHMRIEDAFVETLKVDPEIQARVTISEETVAEYAEAMAAGSKEWPPIVVFREEGVADWVADGFHRVLAAKRAGIPTVRATVYQGTRRDAMWHAAGANQTHGLRRSHADKRRAVLMAILLNPTASDGVIAGHVGVSRPLVVDVRSKLPNQQNESGAPTERIGADGKRYRLPDHPPAPPPRSADMAEPPVGGCPAVSAGGTPAPGGQVSKIRDLTPPDEPVATEIPEAEGAPAADAAPEPAPQAPPEVLDATGRPVPPEAQALWGRRQEVQELLTMLSHIRGAVRRYEESRDPICAQAPINSLHAVLDKAYITLELLKPYAVCPSCAGLLGCRLCCGTGLVNKFRWDTAVSQEQKRALGLA